MEAKRSRSAAIAAVCVLLMMMSGQQVAAMSKFCTCYTECYTACRVHVPRFFCVPFCANKCSPSEATATAAVAVAGGGGGPCWAACAAAKICGLSDPPTAAADVAACTQNCHKEKGRN